MFIRVSDEVGFQSEAVSHWYASLIQPPQEGSSPSARLGPPEDPGEGFHIFLLTPPVAALGWSAFTLHVHGNGFTSDATILWNGAEETTTFVNATELTTGVDMATATTSMLIPVAVKLADGTVSNTVYFALLPAQETPQAIPVLRLYFLGGAGNAEGRLVLIGDEAAKVQAYYRVPSSHLTAL